MTTLKYKRLLDPCIYKKIRNFLIESSWNEDISDQEVEIYFEIIREEWCHEDKKEISDQEFKDRIQAHYCDLVYKQLLNSQTYELARLNLAIINNEDVFIISDEEVERYFKEKRIRKEVYMGPLSDQEYKQLSENSAEFIKRLDDAPLFTNAVDIHNDMKQEGFSIASLLDDIRGRSISRLEKLTGEFFDTITGDVSDQDLETIIWDQHLTWYLRKSTGLAPLNKVEFRQAYRRYQSDKSS